MRLSELCRRAGIYFDPTREDAEITRITSDSGKMIPGGLFVALHGLKHDGDAFIADAREKGAVAVLSESDTGDLRTDDARLALARLCRAFYGEGIERLKLVGVTGTNGKTTIVSLLSSIARAAGKKCACIGTLGCRFVDSDGSEKELTGEGHMTTPDPEVLYLALSEAAGLGAEYAFIEVSSHALAMKRADALRFDVGIFTNLTRDHLDFHGTKEEYIRAKARLAPLCDSFVVNSDDPAAELVGREDSLTCSCREKADFYAGNIRPNGDIGRSYELVSPYGSFEADTRMPGDFSVMNTLEASAAALLLGFEKDSIREGIAGLSCVHGRMEPVALDGADFRVFIDYAHTPDALKKSLITARELAGAEVAEFTLVAEEEAPVYADWDGEMVEVAVFNDELEAKEDTKVLALYANSYYKGVPALTEHLFGKGRVLYFGGAFTEKTAEVFFRKLGVESPYEAVVELPKECEIAVRVKNGAKYFFVLNYSKENQAIRLKETMKNLYTGESLYGEVTLAGYETLVLKTEERV